MIYSLSSGNQSELPIFTVQCFSENANLQHLLFILFLLIYLIIILGNTVVITTITFSSKLHTPHVHVPGKPFFLDYSIQPFPKLLHMVYTQQKTISFTGCIIQYISSYSICYPLHYTLRMSLKHCVRLIAGVWTVGFLDPLVFSLLTANLSFCSSHHIEHFFCDIIPLLKITCSDTSTIESLIYVNALAVGVSTFALLLFSYVYIIRTILRIRSSQGRQKAFSTCSSHLTIVIIFYGTSIGTYLRSIVSYDPLGDLFALLYIALVPMINPFIYTLKNSEFKGELNFFLIRLGKLL
ncbi:hypothetical protein GDO86_013451 [Hymenochirus boettgeri]|uniref:G-protein coupled receptors family 1 profile domain-containing protein n=1 Tax=Hymenochirus boettgeri TaxID=247094 RepID=A0A8T2IWU2_9PIPI|nr:hypothetical protein GDO86_013451 [Hymenochirus boettgeri]